jgi:cytochrome c-type biogenesis protein CcmH/NrfF
MSDFKKISRRHVLHVTMLLLAAFGLLGAGDDARFNDLGHRLMCVCGCHQILLECNHVGCQYSDNMRAELMAAVDRGDNDGLALQSFVQKYGTTVLAAPTKTGFDRVAWITPFVALIVGLSTVVMVVRAWRGRPAPAMEGVTQRPEKELDPFKEQARKETEI